MPVESLAVWSKVLSLEEKRPGAIVRAKLNRREYVRRSGGLQRVHRGAIPFRATVENNSSLPHYHARHCASYRRRAEAVGTHHGVLEISTIDASSCQAHAACSLSQFTESFADEQPSAALTVHTPPCLFYLSLIVSTQLGTVISTVLSAVSPSPDYCSEEPPEEADDCDNRPHEGIRVKLSHGP